MLLICESCPNVQSKESVQRLDSCKRHICKLRVISGEVVTCNSQLIAVYNQFVAW